MTAEHLKPPAFPLKATACSEEAPLLSRLVSTYLFIVGILFLSVRGTFSFLTNANNAVAGTYGELSGAGADSKIHGIEYALIYGLFAIWIASRASQVFSQSIKNWMMFILPVFALISATWSQRPGRSITFAVFILLNTLFAVYLSKRFRPERQQELFLIAGIVICILCFATVLFLPASGIDQKGVGGDYGAAWQGIFPHKNIGAGVLTYFLATVLTYKREDGRYRTARYVALGMIAVLIVMSKSRTGWIVALLTIAFIWAIRRIRRFGQVEKAFSLIVVPLVCIVLGAFVYFNLQDILPLLGKSATLTNRTYVWSASIASALKRPLLGYGYSAFWLGFTGESANTAMMAGDPGLMNAENGILQLWLELGAVGIALLAILLMRTLRNAWICLTRGGLRVTEWYFTILFITLLSIGDGDKFLLPHTLEWTLYVLADIGLASQARLLAAKRIRPQERIQAREAVLQA